MKDHSSKEQYRGDQAESELEALVALYSTLLTKSSQEGDGIWSRFSIMLAVNFGLFSAFVFIFSATNVQQFPFSKCILLLFVCVLGILASGWSFYVLVRLWAWQQYWRNQLAKVERGFPQKEYWPHAFSPEGVEAHLLSTDPGVNRTLLLGYTQPLMAMLVLAWIFLTIIVIAG